MLPNESGRASIWLETALNSTKLLASDMESGRQVIWLFDMSRNFRFESLNSVSGSPLS